MQDAEIKQHGFEQARVNKITFYYLDPPYHKVYDGYAAGRFGDEDHGRLSSFCKELTRRGACLCSPIRILPLIRSLYKSFHIETVAASRSVSCKGSQRGKEAELIIRNYGINILD